MRRRADRGAAAVEFALVVPVLIALLLGIIEYGVWFSDQITIRQAAAAGARSASAWSVDERPTPPWGTASPGSCTTWGSSPSPSSEITALGCSIQASTQTLTTTVYVKIRILPSDQLGASSPTPATGADNWAAPNAVRICLLQVHDSVTGLFPLPREVVTARADMPLEGTSSSGKILGEGQQTLPSGLSWSSSCP